MDSFDNVDVIMDAGSDLIALYLEDPVLAAYDLLGVDLDAIQRVILRDMWSKNYVISVAGRGAGKSFLLGVNAALHALLYPGYRVGLLGPSFRQAKMIFAEIERLYMGSSILREACAQKPIKGADKYHLQFKGTNTTFGSTIEALPLGVDGGKIRGSRFYLIEIDELAQVPPVIIERVLRPMGAVVLNPMKRVRYLEKMNELLKQGLISEDDIEGQAANKIIMTSSGYFKFNHMWKRMCAYWQAIREEEGGADKYAVHQVPYQLLSEGFLEMDNILTSKRDMSSLEFSMEYEAVMVSDSDGFFKASLLEKCSVDSDFSVEMVGAGDASYILGIDPSQGKGARCGIIIVKLTEPAGIVYVGALKNLSIPRTARKIQDLTHKYNIVRICMDSQGGGIPIKDLLEEGYGDRTPILDIDDKENFGKSGKRILEMVNPAPSWISTANFNLLSLLENRRLLFPFMPYITSGLEDEVYNDIKLLKSQLLNIVVSETTSGVRHFDTPKKGQNKDLYSALVLAGHGVIQLGKESLETIVNIETTGLIRKHTPGASFNEAGDGIVPINYFNSAVLQPINKR